MYNKDKKYSVPWKHTSFKSIVENGMFLEEDYSEFKRQTKEEGCILCIGYLFINEFPGHIFKTFKTIKVDEKLPKDKVIKVVSDDNKCTLVLFNKTSFSTETNKAAHNELGVDKIMINPIMIPSYNLLFTQGCEADVFQASSVFLMDAPKEAYEYFFKYYHLEKGEAPATIEEIDKYDDYLMHSFDEGVCY